VQLDGIPAPTWVDEVRGIGSAAGAAKFAPPQRPRVRVRVRPPMEYLCDDSESDASDPEMPALVAY